MTRRVVQVVRDEVRGHIGVLTDSEGSGFSFVDTGSELSLWSYQGGVFSPALARDLGLALVGWADRKQPASLAPVVDEVGPALFDLPDEARASGWVKP